MTDFSGNVAVIGLGSMGLGMAKTLVGAGWDVAGCDLSGIARQQLVEAGGQVFDTPALAAENRNTVISVVVNARQTEAVLFGENGVANVLQAGGVFISCATMMGSML